MSVPKALIEWAIFCRLDDNKDAQLILLKGHLMLEVILSEILEDSNLSFYGKTNKFQNIFSDHFISMTLLELNDIRNEMAHTWNFEVENSGLAAWSDRVLSKIKYETGLLKTKRTKVAHAIAALAGALYQYKR